MNKLIINLHEELTLVKEKAPPVPHILAGHVL